VKVSPLVVRIPSCKERYYNPTRSTIDKIVEGQREE
jgi:vacuolar-type H+-ATPase subunit F/Vma7